MLPSVSMCQFLRGNLCQVESRVRAGDTLQVSQPGRGCDLQRDARTLEMPEAQAHKTVTASRVRVLEYHVASLGPENQFATIRAVFGLIPLASAILFECLSFSTGKI